MPSPQKVLAESTKNDEKEDELIPSQETSYFQKFVNWDIFKKTAKPDSNQSDIKDKPVENESTTKAPSQDTIQIELETINSKLQCDCEKKHLYNFACKQAVTWFTTNVLIMKIRKKQKQNQRLEVSQIIQEEYKKCKNHYKSLRILEPKQESAL